MLTHGVARTIVFCHHFRGEPRVSIMPTYQRLCHPRGLRRGRRHHAWAEDDYLPDLNELKSLVTPETKMICINNPNNPTGALMSKELLGASWRRPRRELVHPL
ncbi:MAG: aminotransferase class I/II-fold pyridoxal phosphate-dependent enzyme [Christensenellales bacterium]